MMSNKLGMKTWLFRRELSLVVTGAFLAVSAIGCKLPCLQKAKPGPALPDTFNGRIDDQSSACVEPHQFFEDPILTGLFDQALLNNQELRILEQDIRIASNEVLARSGAYRPFGFLRIGAGADKPGRFTRAGAVEEQLEIRPGQGFPEPLPDFLIATNISWELDIWHKLRNAQRSACLRYLGTADGRNYVMTRLVAEIAESYYKLLALDQQLRTLDVTIELQEKSLTFARAMKESGRGTELAVQRFQAEVNKNNSLKLIIQQDIVETENKINFLAGRYPQMVDRQSVEFLEITLNSLSVGVPSQLLLNRADIRQAERNLAAAGLDVQVARAEFYPSPTITANIGYQAFKPKYLFNTPESLIYGLAGDLVAPMINRRAIKAEYLTANAEQLQALYEYQRTILNAFTEVINGLSKIEKYGQSLEIKRQQLNALEASVDSATKLFQNHRVEYVEVLLAQRDLQDAKIEVIETKQEQLAAIVNTYQAIGGGILRDYDPNSLLASIEQPVIYTDETINEAATAPSDSGVDNEDLQKPKVGPDEAPNSSPSSENLEKLLDKDKSTPQPDDSANKDESRFRILSPLAKSWLPTRK